MTYEEFKIAYNNAFKSMMKYHSNEVGSSIYAEKMAVLFDDYPDFAKQAENDNG